jgi:hypothetical protein
MIALREHQWGTSPSVWRIVSGALPRVGEFCLVAWGFLRYESRIGSVAGMLANLERRSTGSAG